ncbi:MAG: hypothetical protein ACOX5W_09190 [Bacillota bacterium]|jgi:hypothetical protein
MNNSRGMRRAQHRDENRKKRKELKKRSAPVLMQAKETSEKPKVQPQMSPRTLSLSYFLCMTANLITILSSVVFPVMQNQSLSIQSLFHGSDSLPSLLFQLAALVIVNLMLYRLLLKFNRNAQAKTLGIFGVFAAAILIIQAAVTLF